MVLRNGVSKSRSAGNPFGGNLRANLISSWQERRIRMGPQREFPQWMVDFLPVRADHRHLTMRTCLPLRHAEVWAGAMKVAQ